MLKIFVSAQIRCPLGCLSGPGWVGGDTFYKINYYFGQKERILSHVPHGGGVTLVYKVAVVIDIFFLSSVPHSTQNYTM